ncbi:hypothetical protein F5Y16DRAFT_346525 [Xylariaceae sp. FL0255]|nr:hypothetical protein F5Y16DRAFT_346525 [Xylariaceae sp. FL0255]
MRQVFVHFQLSIFWGSVCPFYLHTLHWIDPFPQDCHCIHAQYTSCKTIDGKQCVGLAPSASLGAFCFMHFQYLIPFPGTMFSLR